MEPTDRINMQFQAGAVFTPGSPVNERDLFAGRIEQLNKIISAASQRGYHAILYGERGVGKTSLSNILANSLRAGNWLVPRVNCDGADTFSSLWRKAFKDIVFTQESRSAGFSGNSTTTQQSLVERLPEILGPDDVRRTMQSLGNVQTLMIFDEFDRLVDDKVAGLMADAIKAFSDFAVPATILLIGVADSVNELISEHQSIERAIVQIPMPRMSSAEVRQIISNGLARLQMDAKAEAIFELVTLSQGLPYITHLLALQSVLSAIGDGRLEVQLSDVDAGINAALDQWQQSIISAYHEATRSSQPDNIYKQVLLACALAETDDMGYFTAASVRAPLRVITGRDYDIPNFAQHLNKFSESDRGSMLQRTGETRRIRYRFSSPLMRPYIVMRGFSDGMINRKQMQALTTRA